MAERFETSRPVPFRGGGFHYVPRKAVPWIGFAIAIGIWQALSSFGVISPLFLPSPESIALALWRLIESGTIVAHLGWSLQRILAGWAIGTTTGLAIGLTMGIFSVARSLGLPFVSALFPIPKIALLPLLILWFGIGEPSKIAVIALGVFFPTVISAYTACDSVPRNLIRMGQSFGLSGQTIVSEILLPGAMPGILSGFRISASIALILVVAAEMIGAQHGIGAFILSAGNLMQTDQLLAGVVVLSILGLLISFVLGRVETWVLRWR
jgi:ABC-type nitrate/sulfonate/bicarbonate transport system permease component